MRTFTIKRFKEALRGLAIVCIITATATGFIWTVAKLLGI